MDDHDTDDSCFIDDKEYHDKIMIIIMITRRLGVSVVNVQRAVKTEMNQSDCFSPN